MLHPPNCPGSTSVKKDLSFCPVTVPELAGAVFAARPDVPPPRHRHRVKAAAGHEHDREAPTRLRPQPCRPQPLLRIAVPQLALAAVATGTDPAVLCQSRSVMAAGSDPDDRGAAMQLRAAHARRQQLILSAVKSELAITSSAAGIDGAILHDGGRVVI